MKRVIAWSIVAVLSGCGDRFKLQQPHEYRCSGDGGAGQCAGNSVCNVTAGYCIDLDAGEPFPCANDLECGHGWRCGIAHVCADPSGEPALATFDLPAPTLVSPMAATTALWSSQTAAQLTPSGLSAWNDLALRQVDGGLVWAWTRFDEQASRVAFSQQIFFADFGFERAPAVNVSVEDTAVTHVLAGTYDGGAFVVAARESAQDGGLTSRLVPGNFERLLAIRRTAARGTPQDPQLAFVTGHTVAFVRTAGLGGSQLETLPPFQGLVADLAYFRPNESGANEVFAAATTAGLEVVTMGAPTTVIADGGPAVALRVGRGAPVMLTPSLSWQTQDGQLHQGTFEALRFGESRQPTVPCSGLEADGGASTLLTWGFDETGALSQQCTSAFGDLTIEQGGANPFYQHRLVTTDATDWWSSSYDTGQLTQSVLGNAFPVTPNQAPDALAWDPRFSAWLMLSQDLTFARVGLGFFIANYAKRPGGGAAAYVDALNLGGEVDTWLVTRSGEVSQLDPASQRYRPVAAPNVTWKTPTAPVLMRHLFDALGIDVLVIAHDDTIDVAELSVPFADLTPRVLPSPGLAVRDLALISVPDGGFAEGFAIAGTDLVALSASTPRRWSTSKVALPASPVHVWYEGQAPRVVLDDGQVVGLSSGTRIYDGLDGLEVVDATHACSGSTGSAVPVVLTNFGVLSPSDAGWLLTLDATDDAGMFAFDFSRGRVFAVDGGWYAFDSSGTAWFGACP